MDPENSERFRDPGTRIEEYLDQVLVMCPRSRLCAYVLPQGPERPHRLTCPQCGYVRVWSSHSLCSTTGPQDPYFHEPLWLQTGCCTEVLWAYNYRHLSLIEAYVRAEIRERFEGARGWQGSSVVARLPGWIKAANNRAEVLRCIAKLREKR
jgi:hypothetical protein